MHSYLKMVCYNFLSFNSNQLGLWIAELKENGFLSILSLPRFYKNDFISQPAIHFNLRLLLAHIRFFKIKCIKFEF
jgi:hypothetical protein